MADGLLSTFCLPPILNVTDGNVSENFKHWKRQVQIYLTASGATDKEDEVQTAIILHCAGPHILDIYDQFVWDADGDENKPGKIL
jgi:hypothetical protein